MSALTAFNPFRTLQDAHNPECMCEACLDADAIANPDSLSDELEDAHEPDCDCSECEYDRECGAADTYNDSVRSEA